MAVYFRNQSVNLNTPLILKNSILRPDAELFQTVSMDDELLPADDAEHFTYSSSSTTLRASTTLTPTVTVDQNSYHYYIIARTLTIPIYDISTKGKGRWEYQFGLYHYEMLDIPANSYITLVDGNSSYGSKLSSLCGGGVARGIYWSSGTAVAIYTATTYGLHQNFVAPSISGSVVTVNTPTVAARGNSSYLASTYYNAITKIRLQMKVDFYRAPKNNLNIDGYGKNDEMFKIISSINSSSHTLI